MKRLLAFLAGALFIILTGLGWLALEFISHPPGNDSGSDVYEVMPNKSLRTIAHELREKGLITSELKFIVLAKILRKQDQIRVGEYAVRKNMLPREILEVIISGKSIEHKVTISEGLNVYEIAKIVEKTGICTATDFLTLVKDKATAFAFLEDNEALTLEGYLYPETYSFTKYTSAKNLVAQMVSNFKKKYESLRVPSDYFLSRHKLVTLASIIEKETGAAEERPMISSVFHNRLKKGMKLETDPTIIYGILDEGKPYPENLTREDVHAPTRYNTYTFTGLPPGPIANPGGEAMLAAFNPSKTQYLFFVSKNNGTHVFSETYEKHKQAVGEFQMKAENREGKSWRDLKKESSAGH